jgi:hypothetical protein
MAATSSTYNAPFITVESFNNSPRFGHSDDLAGVANLTVSWQDYAQGTVFIGGFILAVFVLWFILTALFVCCGQRTVGILSGRRLKQENRSAWHGFYRGLVLGCCIFSLMAGMIYFVKVSSSLASTFDVVREGINSIVNIAENVTTVADDIIQAGEDTIPIRDAAIQLLEQGACSSFAGGNGNTIDFDNEAQTVVDQLTALSDFTRGDLTVLKNNFQTEFFNAQIEVNLVVDKAQSYARLSYYAIAVIFLSTLLSFGGYMAWFGPKIRTYFFVQSWIVLPLYFVVLIMTAIIAGAISAAMVVNSDICMGGESGNPESFIKSIADQYLPLNEYPRQIVDFYILDTCNGDFIGYDSVDNLVNELTDGNQAVVDLKKVLELNQKDFENRCGGGDGSLDGLKSSLVAVNLAFSSFVMISQDARSLLECKPINKIYTDFWHDGVCKQLPNTMFWMFITMILVLVSGMITISLRGALVPELLDDEPDDYYYTKNTERKLVKEESMHQESVHQRSVASGTSKVKDPEEPPQSIPDDKSAAGASVSSRSKKSEDGEVEVEAKEKFRDDDIDGPPAFCDTLGCN